MKHPKITPLNCFLNEKSIPYFVISLALFALFILIFLLKPWYGLMDDGTLANGCRALDQKSVLDITKQWIQGDKDWGMFRPFYPLMSLSLYCPTFGHPEWLFAINAVLVFAILLLLGFFVFKCTAIQNTSRLEFTGLFVLFSLCIYRTHDLFLHPSLQEKLVLLGAALGFFAVKIEIKKPWGDAVEGVIFTLVLVIGLSTKAHYMAFIPALFLIKFSQIQKTSFRDWVFKIGLPLLAAGVMAWEIHELAKSGSYTARYRLENVLMNLRKPTALKLFAVAAVLAWIELRWYKKSKNLTALLLGFFPTIGIVSWIAIFSPWALDDGYTIACVAPFIAAGVIVWLSRVSINLRKKIILVSCFACLFLTIYRGYRGLGRYSDLRKILFSQKMIEISDQKNALLIVPCYEGAALIKIYLERDVHHPVDILQENPPSSIEGRKKYALFDSALCNAPIVGNWVALIAPSFQGSFGLYAEDQNLPSKDKAKTLPSEK